MEVAASPGLLDDLDAANQDADAYHHDRCQLYAVDETDDDGQPVPLICTCPGPDLIRRMAALVGVGGKWPLEVGPIPARLP